MSRLIHGDRVEVFKFKDSGLTECILEAADFIRESEASGQVFVNTTYHRDNRGDHFITFWRN